VTPKTKDLAQLGRTSPVGRGLSLNSCVFDKSKKSTKLTTQTGGLATDYSAVKGSGGVPKWLSY
jgi:hypothetical protein